MNRRTFIGSMGMMVGAVVIPFPMIISKKWNEPGYYGPLTAQQFIALAFNEHVKGQGLDHWPKEMTASDDLYESYEANLQCMQRFTSNEDLQPGVRSLMFKATRLYKWNEHSINERAWGLLIHDPHFNKGHYYDISRYGWAA